MNIHLRNKLHWAHVFFALYYTPVIHVHTLCYVKIGELRATHPLHVHRSAVFRQICLLYIMRGSRRGRGPPTWKIRISYIYIVKFIVILPKTCLGTQPPPPLPGKLKYLFHPPWKKKSGSPHDLPSPFLQNIFPDNVVPLTKESYIHI